MTLRFINSSQAGYIAVVATWLVGLCSSALAQPSVCELNGESINTNNGSAMAGKSGTLRCKRDGVVVREQEVKNGKEIGREMMRDYDGGKVIRSINEMGNSIGVSKKYNKAGILIREEFYSPEGHPGWTQLQGVAKSFDDVGKLSRLSYYDKGQEVFAAEYLPNGKLSGLTCGKRSYFATDKPLCGFSGKPSKVELFGSDGKVTATRTFVMGELSQSQDLDNAGKPQQVVNISGNRKKKTELFPNGKLKHEAEYQDGYADGDEAEYHSSGKMTRRTRWKHGVMDSEETFYLNGERKSRAERKNQKPVRIYRQTFWDNGQVSEQGLFQELTEDSQWMSLRFSRWSYEQPVGTHKRFFENGKLRTQETYNEDGKPAGKHSEYDDQGQLREEAFYDAGTLKWKKRWNEAGKKTLDEEYFEDGSRRKK
jgi:antitoxin component YwqK of YwqJK toxin-antitoxin module